MWCTRAHFTWNAVILLKTGERCLINAVIGGAPIKYAKFVF